MRDLLLSFGFSFSLILSGCQGESACTGASCSDAGGTTSTGSGGGTTTGSTGGTTTGSGDGGVVDKAASCASTFGQALTDSFGRIDGAVLAVVKPTDTQCVMPNDDHLVVQVTMDGAAYRMVVNLQSSYGDPDVQYLEVGGKLTGPAWAEGWHTGITLDYVSDLGVHAADFAPHPLMELADLVTDRIPLGQKISVYATSSGGASAHLVHRNGAKNDGAIVLDPESASPRVLLFHFADQSF